MSKVITLLGSTGSIGTQSLDVCRMHGYEVFGLSANSSVDKLLAQIAEFHPKYVAVTDPAAFEKLSAALAGQANAPKLLKGADGLRELATMDGAGIVLNAVVGIAGLDASLAAIESGHDLALANKESLVTGGHLVTDAVRKNGVHLLPVDSEHSAIFQCLQDQHSAKTLEKILLTASGGPFFSVLPEKKGEKRGAWLRLVRSASEFRRGPMFQASFHTIVTSRASWYAPPDTGEIRFATSCLRTVAVNRRCSRNFDGYYLLAGQVVGAGLCSAPTKRLDKLHSYALICRYPIYRPST